MADTHFRYRRLIDLYRHYLLGTDPCACGIADQIAGEWGEGWVSDTTPVNVNQWMSAKQISERFGIPLQNIYSWHRRHPEDIQRVKKDGRVVFWLADVLRYQSSKDSR